MTSSQIRGLFANDITREIEEVIKVDQTDEEIIRSEIDEYIVTDAIADHYVEILERYDAARNKPHEGIAIWVSGFFGSGKSSFAKMLGLAIENRDIVGKPAGERFAARTSNRKIRMSTCGRSPRISRPTLSYLTSRPIGGSEAGTRP